MTDTAKEKAAPTTASAPRIVSRFSCGAASAVATKLALLDFGPRVRIVNAYLEEEHKDNARFMADCEAWFGQNIIKLRDVKYGASAFEVWRRHRFIASRKGQPCSVELKKAVLEADALPDDVFVLGYTAEETDRVDNFIDKNNGRSLLTPLIDRGLTHNDCLALVERVPIKLPAMYGMGFANNNCIGCCKGGVGYWNRIRKFFPETFEKVAGLQRILGPGSYFFRDRTTNVRFSLDELKEGQGRHDEPEPSCSVMCELVQIELGEEDYR